MAKRETLHFLFLCTATLSPALAARWTDASTGLPGAVPGVTKLVADRATGSTLYALGTGGVMFKSADSGASWKILGSITGALNIALDPASTTTVYAGTAHGLVKSTDGGETWEVTGLADNYISALAIDPTGSTTLYAGGSGDRIYKTTDGGVNWTSYALGLPASPFVGIASIIVDPATPSNLYVLPQGPGPALYRSIDGAVTWQRIDAGPFARLLAIDPKNAALYAIRFNSGFSKSTDGGATWTALGLTKDVITLAFDPRDSSLLYASVTIQAGSSTELYKSVDGGRTWNLISPGIPVPAFLAVNPADSSTIYAATFTGGVFKSTDAGATWRDSNTGLRILNIQVLAGDPVDPNTLYLGGDDGLFQTIDGGSSWNERARFQVTCCSPPPGLPPGLPPPPSAIPPFPPVAPAGVHALLIDFTNPNILYTSIHRMDGCVFSDSNLFKSTDDGSTWSDSISPRESGCLADALLAMDPADPNTLYLRYGDFLDGFGLMRTADGGSHWTSVAVDADQLDTLVVDPTDDAKIYAGTNNGIVRSSDHGTTWKGGGLAKSNVHLLAIDPRHTNVLYAATTGFPQQPGVSGLFKSTDSGATWSPINAGLEDAIAMHTVVNALVMDLDQPDTLYLGTSGYGVFKSSDGGVTWMPWNDGLTHLDVRALTVVRGSVVYAGTPGGVFRIEQAP